MELPKLSEIPPDVDRRDLSAGLALLFASEMPMSDSAQRLKAELDEEIKREAAAKPTGSGILSTEVMRAPRSTVTAEEIYRTGEAVARRPYR